MHKKRNYDQLVTFTRAESTNEVKKAGERFILTMYDASKFQPLDEYRYIAFKRGIVRSTSFQLENLLPISATAKQHSYCAFHTVQQ